MPTSPAATARTLGIIPARGGSKGVPRKNIKLLGGRPLLVHVLAAALKARNLSRVVVSSEDDEILKTAEEYGGSAVPLRRPIELAQDDTPDVPMLQHAVREVEAAEGLPFDYVVQLHATTPFMSSDDIDSALQLLVGDPLCDSIVTVLKVTACHPKKLKRITSDKWLVPYLSEFPEMTTSRRQDLEPVFKRNGGLYAARRSVVMQLGRVWGNAVRAYVMPEERSLEIDTPMDFLVAELLMQHFSKGNS